MKKIFYIVAILMTITLASCKHEFPKTDENISIINNDNISALEEKQKVKVMVIRKASFQKEIISNGKLIAIKKADLKFRNVESIAKIYVRNGDRIKKGQKIAVLDTFIFLQNLKQSINQYNRSRIDLQDILLSQGYDYKDSAKIPTKVFVAAKIRSGYEDAKTNLDIAKYNYNSSTLRAPFSGLIADLNMKENNISNLSMNFCTIIDNEIFEATFPILESELKQLKNGDNVLINPYAYLDISIKGEIIKINPRVDSNGMLSVGALCRNTNNILFDGMNVRITLNETIRNQIVLPKLAVVDRNEKHVVFKYYHGLAKWIYVTIGSENSSSITIIDGLNVGDSVIYSGSLNLANDSQVEIENVVNND